ncbi:OmpH family outer membrane protein [Burkholderiaceae bacterium DAT-1]|nr:OmpH family outer membrane protein [Burkholderiaceae bacterium DAT-1]
MKMLQRACALFLLLTIVVPVSAADLKIGFVDYNRIIREARIAERIAKKLEKEFAPRLAEINNRSEDIRSRQADIDRLGSSLQGAELRERERELARKSEDLNRLQRDFREDQNKRRNQEIAGLQEHAFSIITQIAVSEKYDLILQDALYFNPRLDITDKVLERLVRVMPN